MSLVKCGTETIIFKLSSLKLHGAEHFKGSDTRLYRSLTAVRTTGCAFHASGNIYIGTALQPMPADLQSVCIGNIAPSPRVMLCHAVPK